MIILRRQTDAGKDQSIFNWGREKIWVTATLVGTEMALTTIVKGIPVALLKGDTTQYYTASLYKSKSP